MKILAHCYTYGRNSSSGADKMLQSLMEFLSQRGAECHAVIDECAIPYELNCVHVSSNKSMLGEQYDWCDAVIIHLVAMHEAWFIAKRFNKPVIHICHNEHIKPNEGNIVYNSYHLQQSMNMPLNSIVVHPFTPEVQVISHFDAPYITLVNTCDNKGGAFMLRLAQQMPRYKFLGVHGGYGMQQQQPMRNVTYRPYSAAEMDYSDTRILIVPSKQESWSLAASEAMAHTIPIICSDLPGLRENCAYAAMYASTVKDYVDAVGKLSDWIEYEIKGVDCKLRAAANQKQSSIELNNFYNFIENIIMPKQVKTTADTDKKTVVTPGNEKPKQTKGLPKEKKESKGLPTQK